MKQNQKGFTLIELLVVVAIIGLLASVVVVSLNGARIKARDAKRVADVRAIQGALELYASENGSYPTSVGTTSLAPGWTDTSVNVGTGTGGMGAYMSSLPVPPSVDSTACSGITYTYKQKSGGADYYLKFCLSADTGSYKSGVNYMTSTGVLNQTAAPTGTYN